MIFFCASAENSVHPDDKKQNGDDRENDSSAINFSALDDSSADLLKRTDPQIIGHFLPLIAAF